MTNPKIAPRVDDDGVGWCNAGCPQLQDQQCHCGEVHLEECAITKRTQPDGEVCPVWAKRMVELLEEVTDCFDYNEIIDIKQKIYAATGDPAAESEEE